VTTTAPAEVATEAVVSTSSTDEGGSTDADAGTTEAVVSTTSTDEGGSTDEGEFGPDSAAPREDGSAPEGFEIKGNKNSMKFHAPSSPWYARTNAEVWFRSAEAAEAAGFANAESTEAAAPTSSTDGEGETSDA
jgi:small subunit ribosomal protein S2